VQSGMIARKPRDWILDRSRGAHQDRDRSSPASAVRRLRRRCRRGRSWRSRACRCRSWLRRKSTRWPLTRPSIRRATASLRCGHPCIWDCSATRPGARSAATAASGRSYLASCACAGIFHVSVLALGSSYTRGWGTITTVIPLALRGAIVATGIDAMSGCISLCSALRLCFSVGLHREPQ
jgi:hypothetical protein